MTPPSEVSAGAIRSRVLVIYTGGTIGMVQVDPQNPASPLRPGTLQEIREALNRLIPDLGVFWGIGWDLVALPRTPALDSADVTPAHWVEMAEVILQHHQEYDGFVLLHGTDTMAYTASGLSFVFSNLDKPVVLTGSQLPLNDERTDARLNLINALSVAGHRATSLPLIPEVVLCFGNSLLRGNRATKSSTADLNGFESPNFPKLGTLDEQISIRGDLLLPQPIGEFGICREMASSALAVLDLGVSPALSSRHLRQLMELEELGAIVLRTYGSGNLRKELVPVLREAVDSGKTVVNVTSCRKGLVRQGRYESSYRLWEAGVCTGLDMTPEAALAKCIWLLATRQGSLKSEVEIAHRGEQSFSLLDLPIAAPLQPTARIDSRVQPAAACSRSRLRRAALRLSGVQLPPGEAPLRLRLYLNFPDAGPETACDHASCFGELFLPRHTADMVEEVSLRLRPLYEPGREMALSLIADGRLRFSSGSLALSFIEE